jgi:hypothetical protein
MINSERAEWGKWTVWWRLGRGADAFTAELQWATASTILIARWSLQTEKKGSIPMFQSLNF